MILSIYKSRLFRYPVYFFIVIIVSGCYSKELIKDYTIPVTDVTSITKIDLKDGKTINFKDTVSSNKLVKIDKAGFTYKNWAGVMYTKQISEVVHIYQDNYDQVKSIFFIIGMGIALFALLFKMFSGNLVI